MKKTAILAPVKLATSLLFILIGCSTYSAVDRLAEPQIQGAAPELPFVSGTSANKLLPPQTGMYLAAFPDFGPTEDRVSSARIGTFVSEISGKPIVWAYFSDNWFDGIRFPGREVAAIRRQGVIPYIRMMPRGNWAEGCADRTYRLEGFLAGRYDRALRAYARAAKNSGGPIIAEFGTEVNGDWFPWSGVCNGGGTTTGYGSPSVADGPERFRDAYRRIINIFRDEGAHNVTWFMHYNSLSAPNASWNDLSAYYPGDDYIDWLGLSAFGAQSPNEMRRWNPNFREVMDLGYSKVARVSSSKPIALLEFGVVEQRGKPRWVSSALADLKSGRYPRVKAVSWWHSNWRNRDGSISRMRLDTSEEALTAYRSAVADPLFVSSPRLSN